MALGIRQKPGHDTAHLCKPTAVSAFSGPISVR